MEKYVIGERYEIEKQLGSGANGCVYLVWDKKLQKFWAMKECEDLNENELLALKRIDCPSFPRIVDYVEEAGKNYLIMDLIKGDSLEQLGRVHRFSSKEIIRFGVNIAKALLYLHQMTPPIYYLDCKPSNVMITENGEIRMVDVGSALSFQKKDASYKVSGTRFYAPIEQRQKEKQGKIDERTDIYGLGRTLYVLLTGKERECLDKRGRLRIRPVNPKATYGLCHIIEKCCEKDPKDRYQTMEEVIYALEHEKEIGRKYGIMSVITQVGRSVITVILIGVILYCAWKFWVSSDIWWGILAISLLLLEFIRKNASKYQVQEIVKDQFGGMGKKILIPILLASFLLGGVQGMAAGEERLKVELLDNYGRKVLIKEGGVWTLDEDILIRIPLEEIGEGEQTIQIQVQSDENTKRKYKFRCKKKQCN